MDPIQERGRIRNRGVAGVVLLLLAACLSPRALPAVRDLPFRQPVSVEYLTQPDLQGVTWQRLCVNRDGIAYILTNRGVVRPFEERVALDRSFRPLADKRPLDITLHGGDLHYLYEDRVLSNGSAGKPLGRLPPQAYQRLVLSTDGTVLLSGRTNLALYRDGRLLPLVFTGSRTNEHLYSWANQFYVLADDVVYRVVPPRAEVFHRGQSLTALAFRANEMLVGTRRGYYAVDLQTGKLLYPLQDRLPAIDITCLAAVTNGLWVGTTRGLFFQSGPKLFRYFASRRWLQDDQVIDLGVNGSGDVFVLTAAGLNKIEFRPLTLAQKAAYYDRKIRLRHIRYGFCSEIRLARPGDLTSAEMIDTDNDGTWSSYYMASQAFRYAVTGEEEARANAWETFATIERLQSITGLNGFPARTFERTGFKFSDPERWHPSPEPGWDWKGTTSSDEITCQTFGYAVLYEAAARTPQEKQRIASAYDRIISHIVRNNLYLIDVDGQPTLWGRWNPEYVNHFPRTVGDRRLNSAEIIAFLQFAWHLTGNTLYRERGSELLQRHGYLENLTNSMANIRFTPGFTFRGIAMGDEWNHSDDELAFFNYWTLYRYAFTEELRRLYGAAIRDHWLIEQVERNPVWNFLYASTGAPQFDAEGAIWSLQNHPLDLIGWTIQNSQRRDLTLLPANFRHRQSEQLLPADERPTMRWNGNPFILDGGDGGQSELAGDEFLLPYWMGRYLRIIQ